MDLDLNKEQELLRKTAREFLTKNCPPDFVREMGADERGYPTEMWRQMADLGWLGLGMPEEYEGSGGDFVEIAALLEEMGRVCFPGPFVPSTVVAAGILVEAGTEDQKKEFLPKIANGECILSLALLESDVDYNPASIGMRAVREGDGFRIDGTKLFVADAHAADYLICAARTGDDPTGGITLFLVAADTPGITINPLDTFAGNKTSEVIFDNVPVPEKNIVGGVDAGHPYLKNAVTRGAVAMCAQMLGSAQRTVEMAVEHSRHRVQFGKPVGSFQAVQFLCADALTNVDGARLLTYKAACAISEGAPCDKAVAIAKSWVSDAYSRALEATVEVHGGQGIMDDEQMSLHTKRALDWRTSFGDADFHREALARELGM